MGVVARASSVVAAVIAIVATTAGGAACGDSYGADAPPVADTPEAGSDAPASDASPPTCVPACGAHATCTGGASPQCTCVVGYEKSGAACVWKGTLRDPGFQNMPAGAWTLGGGVSIDPAATGSVSPGLARFPSACAAGTTNAVVRQSFDMPAVSAAEPLALSVTTFCDVNIAPFDCFGSFYQLSIGGRDAPIPYGGGNPPMFHSDAFCLGERAFGGKVDLVLTGPCRGNLGVDHVAIAPPPSTMLCPAPGAIGNPDFESVSGWKASGTGAEVATGIGTAGGRAGRLTLTKLCDDPTLTGIISIPSASMKSPALVMSVKGTKGTRMSVSAGDTSIGTVTGTDVFEAAHLCLPEWSRGASLALTLNLRGTIFGACGTAVTASQFIVDDLSIVSDPSCADGAPIFDGGFEAQGSGRSWTAQLQTASVTFSANGNAHSGAYYGNLSSSTCAQSFIRQFITVPEKRAGLGGPQLRFWYRAYGDGPSPTFIGGQDSLPAANVWTQHLKCLDPTLAGHAKDLEFQFYGNPGCTAMGIDIDDVEVVTDKACPE